MVATDADALYCDMVETYHILDYRALPARQAARLASGLRPSSRIKMALSGVVVDTETMLLALIADAVRVLAWQNTRDGMEGKNAPKSLAALLANGGKDEAGVGFDSVEDFEAWRASMIGGDLHA
jgi:hypothetical protein